MPAVPRALSRSAIDDFAADAKHYLSLTPRQLPARYFYDALGSALFSAICELPWYPITRAETRLLDAHGTDILRRATASIVLELGAGNGDKLKLLLAKSPRHLPLTAHVVDVSASALQDTRQALSGFEHLAIATHEASYEDGLDEAAESFRSGDRVLVLFLGSNIGNFDPAPRDTLLKTIRGALRPGDHLLLGVDLVKPADILERAYDDPLGVTAAFNRNILVRANRELGANFSIEDFVHRAHWNAAVQRVEMHLESRREQVIAVPQAGLTFTLMAGERIWTESSYKYNAEQLPVMLEEVGFRSAASWIEADTRFALTLAEAI